MDRFISPEQDPLQPQHTTDIFQYFHHEIQLLTEGIQEEMRQLTVVSTEQHKRVHFVAHHLHYNFGHTALGKKLLHASRFTPYKPEWLSKEAWDTLLGLDVDNYHHGLLTYQIMQAYLKHIPRETITQTQRVQLLLATLVHDWGEAIKGDIPYDEKQDAHITEEYLALQQLLQSTFAACPTVDVFVPVLLEILTDSKSSLHQHFTTVEHIGYLRTALRAWRVQQHPITTISLSSDEEQELGHQLRCLTHNVFGNIISKVTKEALTNPGVEVFLTTHQEMITTIFLHLANTDTALTKYKNITTFEKMKPRYNDAFADWHHWQKEKNPTQ